MPRPLRIEFEGAWYHVMNRGANHQNIFHNDNHRNHFLSLLKNISTKFHVEIHAFCLMDNHYHLLLHTPLANLGKTMRYLDGLYTQRFNRLEDRDGPLFRGRYKSILVDETNYLLQVSRYIHLNPVEAFICKTPDQYEWSSYLTYINRENKFNWLHTKCILEYISNNPTSKSYQNYVEDGNDTETINFYDKLNLRSMMGCKDFIENNLSKIENNKRKASSHDINRIIKQHSIQKISAVVTQYFNLNIESLITSVPGKRNHPRIIAIYLSKYFGQYTHQIIGDYFSINAVGISAALKRCDIQINNCYEFKMHIENLIKILSQTCIK